jgi:UDP-N-acetylglucosamine 2-epimerase (non-hydrolysing)
MKVAPIAAALKRESHASVLVHTGQHYDVGMSEVFFRDRALPEPDFRLGVGSGSHADQTARVMDAFEPVLREVAPDWVLVVGDVNSTLAAALVTAKLRAGLRCRLVHVEAGLRSGDWTMPEEVNRVLTDRVADLLLIPSREAQANLAREGIDAARVVFVGNVMTDSLMAHFEAARARNAPGNLGLDHGRYAVATLHRPSNVDDPRTLATILHGFTAIADRTPVVFPVHPRTRKNLIAFGLADQVSALRSTEPLGYLDMLSLVDGAAACLTDSGGLQGETTVLGVPCVTLRQQTEWSATVERGTNRLAPWPLTTQGILGAFAAAERQGRIAVGTRVPEAWDGHAAERIVTALANRTSS